MDSSASASHASGEDAGGEGRAGGEATTFVNLRPLGAGGRVVVRVEVVELALRHEVHPVLGEALHVPVGREATHLEPRGRQCVGVTRNAKRERRRSRRGLKRRRTDNVTERLRLGLTGRVDTTSHFPPRAMSAMLRAPAAVAFRGDHHAARDTRRVRASASSDVDRP
jgi:hypothetical protein